MNFPDIPKLSEWLTATGRTVSAPSGVGLTGRALYMFKIDKLVEQYNKVLPMAKYHTLLDLQPEVAGWRNQPTPTLTGSGNFQSQVSLQDAVKALEDVADRKLKAYPPRKYDEVVFAGYCIQTGTVKDYYVGSRNIGTADGYMGNANVNTDLATRCNQMVQAIQKAVTMYRTTYLVPPKKVRDDRKTLKLFMAPEFFFRGAEGAFDLGLMMGTKKQPGVMDRLREETSKYPDWLFVLGTYVAGTEETGVGCFNHTPGKWMSPAVAAWDPNKRVLTCPQCHAQLRCTCGALLTVFKPNVNPPQYWNADRDYFCPKCNTRKNFQEIIKSIIIDNYAMVQKGGYSRPDGVNDYCMQKKLISNLDFEKLGGDNVKLFGGTFEASEPAIGGANERMGGGVFTMDGITFGMEICLDHLSKRLVNAPDARNISIQLIPAAGMDIKSDSVACMPNGLLFNVDGGGGTSDLKINGLFLETKTFEETGDVPNCSAGCFPDPGDQSIDLFGPFDIPYM